MLAELAPDPHIPKIDSPLIKRIWVGVVGLLFLAAGVVLIRVERATDDLDYAVYALGAFLFGARLCWIGFRPGSRQARQK
jgi:hypothetical protein